MESIESILDEKGRAVHTAAPDVTVLEAVEKMCAAHVGALIVMHRESIVGVFSERDLIQRVVLARLNPARVQVRDVMTTRVVCTGGKVSPTEAMEVMTRECVRHLPVLHGRRIEGIISMGDLVRWAIRDRDHAVQQLTEYVAGKYPG
jgi:CBS domain-containing protein